MAHEDVEIEQLVSRIEDLTERLFDLTQEAADARADAERWQEKLAIAERFVAVARDALHAAREMREMARAAPDLGGARFWRDVARAPELERIFERAVAVIDDEAAVVAAYVSLDDVVAFLFGRDAQQLADRDACLRIGEALRAGSFRR